MKSFTFQRTLKTEGNIEESSVLPRARYLLLEAMKREQAGGTLTADARRAEAQGRNLRKKNKNFAYLKLLLGIKLLKIMDLGKRLPSCADIYIHTRMHTHVYVYIHIQIYKHTQIHTCIF